ncbi:MAG: DUF885 domain-containing protein [Firmicutes bacterium]|nr:DUF885 domain-containing protein [Bacillota bacterium]
MRKKSVFKRLFVITLALVLATSLTGCMLRFNYSVIDESPSNDSDDDWDVEAGWNIKSAKTRSDNNLPIASEAEKTAEQERFASFIDEQFKSSVEASYFATHIYYIDPEAAGIDMSNVDVGFGTAPTEESYAEGRDYYDAVAEEFASFNRSFLTEEQQIEYDGFKWEVAIVKLMSDERFDFYEQYFAPPNSLDANIVSYLSTFEIRHERDAKDVATLLNSIPKYVDSTIEYAKIQQDKGLLMTDFDVVIEGCQDVIDIGMESSVLSNFLETVDGLDLAQEAKDKYKEAITNAFRDSYLPSFQKIIDGMEEMRGGYNNTEGYAAFPYGKEYYEANLMYATGTLDSVEEINSYLEAKEEALLADLFDIYSKYPSEVNDYYSDKAPGSGYTSYQEILEANKTALLTDHPEVKNLDYHIEDADPEEKLAEKNIAAYFLIPPIDGDIKQQMRVEPTGRDVESLDTYITVSHEGFPGHMYHYAYLYSNIESDYTKTLGVDSVVEGYAVYAELEALDYLPSVKEGFKKLIKVSTPFTYADYSLADIGINYYGWSQDDMHAFFEEIGYSFDSDVSKEIYDYLRCTPGAYEPYGYGYLRIADMRQKAEDELGSKFTTLGFNTALLKPGAVPFSVIEKYISQYIEENK